MTTDPIKFLNETRQELEELKRKIIINDFAEAQIKKCRVVRQGECLRQPSYGRRLRWLLRLVVADKAVSRKDERVAGRASDGLVTVDLYSLGGLQDFHGRCEHPPIHDGAVRRQYRTLG